MIFLCFLFIWNSHSCHICGECMFWLRIEVLVMISLVKAMLDSVRIPALDSWIDYVVAFRV
jgi:hypothetical protein